MKNPLQELIGLRVTKVQVVHDYVRILFGEVAGLRIFNDFMVSGTKDTAELTNLVLSHASQNAGQIVLTFEGGTTLSISLLPEAYQGPEAMVLNVEGKPPIVWN
jgi:hypothetical protein